MADRTKALDSLFELGGDICVYNIFDGVKKYKYCSSVVTIFLTKTPRG